MSDNPLNVILVRISGEIPIKSEPVRARWERLVLNRIRKKVDELGYVRHERGRIYVHTEKPHEVMEKLRTIFGISSLSPAASCKPDLESIKKRALEVAKYYITKMKREKNLDVKTFAIIAKKVISNKFGTTEVRYDVGAYIKENLNLQVNLDHPDLPLHIEVRRNEAFIYTEIIEGAGGIPVGVQEPVIVLYNGDRESTLSMWLMLKRGCPIIVTHFIVCPEKHYLKSLEKTAEDLLANWGEGLGKIYTIDLQNIVSKITEKIPLEHQWIVLRKTMILAAELIAEKEKAKAIVLGDKNPLLPDSLPVLRVLWTGAFPLYFPTLGLSSEDVDKLSRKIAIKPLALEYSEARCKLIEKMKQNAKILDVGKVSEYLSELGINKVFLREIISPKTSV